MKLILIIFLIFTYNYVIQKFKVIPKFENLVAKSKLLKLLNINLDIFIRTLFITFSFLWITYLGSKLGEDYLAVNTILMQFIILSAFFAELIDLSLSQLSLGLTIINSFKEKLFITLATMPIFSGNCGLTRTILGLFIINLFSLNH